MPKGMKYKGKNKKPKGGKSKQKHSLKGKKFYKK